MTKLWNKYAPYWHICTAIIFGLFWATTYWNQVAASVDQTKINTADISNLKVDMAAMKQHIDDIWHDFGHKE